MTIVRRVDTSFDMTFGYGLANFARDSEAVAQAVRTRLQLLFNEWFLDTSAGVPYLQQGMVKPANLPLIESMVKQTIVDTDGVAELRSFTMSLDRETRRLTIAATVATIYGDTTNIQVTQ